MANWFLGTAGILIGTFIVAVGNNGGLQSVALFRRFGWSILFLALLLLLVTLVNEAAVPGA